MKKTAKSIAFAVALAAAPLAARKCRRHLSRIAQMDFYDRIRLI